MFGERAAELASIASSLLGWRPQDFWESTPAELEASLGLSGSTGDTMERASLERLLGQFPDNRAVDGGKS